MEKIRLTRVLRWVVATTALESIGGCSTPEIGTLDRDDREEGERVESGPEGCRTEQWKYRLPAAYACEVVRETVSVDRCASLCDEDEGQVHCSAYREDEATSWSTAGTCPSAEAILICTRHLSSGSCVVEGRLTEGVRPDEEAEPFGSLATYFARGAFLEAAAVHAFVRLEEELVAHAAPVDLVARTRAAADDERRHAVATAALAREFGGTVETPVVGDAAVRSLLDVARENAVEGVVRETFGAAVALWRAEHATDPRIAAVLRGIAEDECRHAELSWDLAAWMETRLSAAERTLLAAERERARRDLAAAIDQADPVPEVVAVAGVPTRPAARTLFARLDAALWAA